MLAGFQGAAVQVLLMGVQIILMLRGMTITKSPRWRYPIAMLVQALYHDKTYLKYLLRGLFLLEHVIMVVLFALTMPAMRFGVHCVVTSFPTVAAGFL